MTDADHGPLDAAPASAVLRLPRRVRTALRVTAFAVGSVAVAVSWFGRRRGWLEFRPGGSAFELTVRPVLAVVFVVGLVVALRRQMIGGVIAAFAAGALAVFAVRQLEPSSAALVVAGFAVPALCWILLDLATHRVRMGVSWLLVALAATIGGAALAQRVYTDQWGPTHPESSVVAPPPSAVEWIWSGGVTPTGAIVKAKPAEDVATLRLAVGTEPGLATPRWFEPTRIEDGVATFVIDGLEPGRVHHYAVSADGLVDLVRAGTFATVPVGRADFTVAFGACARVGSNGAVFDAIRAVDPLMYVITGDFHYGDIGENDREAYREVLDLTLTRPAQAALYRQVPVAYVWDDHDYGDDNADRTAPGRSAAMATYRNRVPSYPLAGPESAIHQAFTIGRVRFVLTDARSMRDPRSVPLDERSMLGAEQRAWLLDELVSSSATHAAVVWVNPVPWVADVDPDGDDWGGFPEERRLIADALVDGGVDNLVMVSGDAHMVAIDDGTNTDYSTAGAGGFPLLHAAPLDRPGRIKGGPYSEGVVADGGQFGTLTVDDDGDEVTITLEARDWTGSVLLSHEVRFAGRPAGLTPAPTG